MIRGEIVLVRFPFSDLETSKKRPALALVRTELNSKVKLTTLAMITSQIDGLKLAGDYSLVHWEKAGLLNPSLVRLSKVATVEGGLIVKSLGQLTPKDFAGIQASFRKQFNLWI